MKLKQFKDISISAKILSLIIISILPIFLIVTFYILPIFEEKSYENKKETLRNTIHVAHSILKTYNDQVMEGKLTIEDAQKKAVDEINKLRYSGKEYFYAYDLEGITKILGSDVTKLGSNRLDLEDKKGNKFVREMVRIVKENEKGEGFLTYYYPKLGETEPLPKLAFIKLFEPWKWVIGTGLYTDDVEAELSKLKTNIYIAILLGILLVLLIGYFIAKKIANPIKQITKLASEIANGNFNEKLLIEQEDEIGTLAVAFNSLSTTVVDLNKEVSRLITSSKLGNLSVRGESSKFKGEFKEIVGGINGVLDAVIGPLNVAAEYVDRIAKGDIPQKITEEYKGDFNEIKNNLNTCIDAVAALVTDTKMLVASAVEGKLSVRADAQKHKGDYNKIVQGINDTLDAVIGPLNVAAQYVERISNGDLPEKITAEYNGDFNTIVNNLNTLLDTVGTIFSVMKRLAMNMKEGKTSDRGNIEIFKGDWKEFVDGINSIIEGPLNRMQLQAFYFEKISKGDIPPVISEEWPGDYSAMRNNINQCINAINNMLEEAGILAKSAIEGRLSTRADVSKHYGDFRKIIQGVNDTLDAVINPLNVAAGYVDRISKGEVPEKISENYKGDFNNIKNNLNLLIAAMTNAENAADQISRGNLSNNIVLRSDNDKLMKALINMTRSIQSMVDDINKLSESAVAGKLNERADTSKHEGDFRKIVEGVNNTLNSVVLPLNMAADSLAKIARGEEITKITEEYRGDFNLIKNNINTCGNILNGTVDEIVKVTNSAVNGELKYRSDATKYAGQWFVIVDGINKILNAVISPINEGVAILEKMATGDLTVRITSEYKGDHQLIKNSINTVTESLNQALLDVSEAIAATASASNQISSSTEEMAAGSQEQTQQTTEVAGGVEEMTKTILENTKNASYASDTAKNAGDKAKEGGRVVTETISGMNRIADVVKKSAETVQELGRSSDQIGEIIQVIDDIADQTNLLALNAAIEAARAGEQGRGFAVVADEVRKLAERTTKATKEIASMIKHIQKDTENAVASMDEGTGEVEKGKLLANRAGESLTEIVEESQKVMDIITQVAAASEEQSSAAEEISKNIEAINSVSQETATGIQQIAHAAEDLNRLTLNLENLISRFKLSDHQIHKQVGQKSIAQHNIYHKGTKGLLHH